MIDEVVRRQNRQRFGSLAALLGLAGGAAIASAASSHVWLQALVFVPGSLLIAALAFLELIDRQERGRLRAARSKLSALGLRKPKIRKGPKGSTQRICFENIEALSRQRIALTQPGRYGTSKPSKWEKELDFFIDEVVLPELAYVYGQNPSKTLLGSGKLRRWADQFIRKFIEAGGGLRQVPADEIEALSPAQFEAWCADALRKAGWNKVWLPAGSGDQGADVIAEHDGQRLVLQCKRYSRAVGNTPVQEISSARAVHQAEYAAVVASNGYTKGAEQAAKANQILLLAPAELSRLGPQTLLAEK